MFGKHAPARTRRTTGLLLVGLAAVVLCLSSAASTRAADGTVPNPTLEEASGGHGQAAGGLRYDVGAFGYQEKEYFFSGVARPYGPQAPNLAPAPYTSRMIVWTPIDPAKFNGTTVVEWAEVSDFGQFELTVEINYQSSMLEAQGYAFALVSAEEGGVCDASSNGCTATSLKGADPVRYARLNHPGDSYSFDIFSQALQAIKHPQGLNPLGQLLTDVVIAEGFQPSADKWQPEGPVRIPVSSSSNPLGGYGPLNAYIENGADRDAQIADAFLLDSGGPAADPVAGYRVPTLHHITEDGMRRRPTRDSTNHVIWEVAGAPHADRWAGDHSAPPSSDPPAKLTRQEEEARRDQLDNFGQDLDPTGAICAPTADTGSAFPRRFTLNSGVVALDNWIRTGVPAPAAPRVERPGQVPVAPNTKLNRDLYGNAIGGLRSPIMQVPVATYNGEGCIAAGTMTPLNPVRLVQLYPTHQSYVEQMTVAVDDAVAGRYLLCQDAMTIMRKASSATIGGIDAFRAEPDCAEES